MSTRTSRFPPSDAALNACTEVVQKWASEHGIESSLEEPIHILASRVNSWIEPRSVFAGVDDVMGIYMVESPDKEKNKEILTDLGNLLSLRLAEDNLLVATRRRGAGLG